MTYHAFVSYSRKDEGWAAKLADGLRQRGFEIFLDKKRIAAGDQWDQTLRDALMDSRHLLLLWSDEHASASEWVRDEAAAFRMLIHEDFRRGRANGRTLIQICLKGRNDHYAEFQVVPLINDSGHPLDGADTVDPNLWSRVVEQVASSIETRDDLPAVHQVVLASTLQNMSTIPDEHRATTLAPSFGELLAKIGLQRVEALARYGDERCAWRPFGSARNVLTLLNQLRAAAINAGAPRFCWKPVDPEFWTGLVRQRIDIVDVLCKEPAVIVLDALSLYDNEVSEQYNNVLECLANESAAVMVLPPFSHDPRSKLRDFLEVAAQKLFDQYYHPKLAQGRRVAAQCNVITDDETEMGRLMLHVVAAHHVPRHRALRMR